VTQLKYSVPSVGEKNTVAEPKVDTALTEIKTVVNGELNSENLKSEGVAKSNLSAELKTELGSFVGLPLEAKKSIIATEQERESATFGTLSTPDEVEVTLPENGLIAVVYQATWKESVGKAARAAIFLGANQLKFINNVKFPVVQEAFTEQAGSSIFGPLATYSAGLKGLEIATESYTGDVTTGQSLGLFSPKDAAAGQFGGGPCYIFAAAGTYKVSVRFKSTSGKVTVKNRKLLAWVIG
jgi:hypothetical protein